MYVFTKNPVAGSARHTPGKLNLRISGFSRQHVVSVNDIVQAIDILPSFHLEGLREIVYAPDLASSQAIDSYSSRPWGHRKGEFNQNQRRIVFFDFDQPSLFYQILYHEIGHFVFFLVIGSRVKKQWVTEIFPHSKCITPYGALNASEDFAETYACYVRAPEALNQFPEKYAFMRDCVFSGMPDTLKEKD